MARAPVHPTGSLIAPTMGYNIDWVLPRLRNPSGLWQFASKLTIAAVGIFSKILISK